MKETREFEYIGHAYDRFDIAEKVRGAAVYGTDLTLPGMLIGKVLRSPYAHAKILRIDVSKAREAPGVIAVLTGADHPWRIGRVIYDQPFLALDKVIFAGEPVAAVAAETEAEAERALALIEVEYEPLTPVLDVEEAAEPGAPLVHPNMASYQMNPPGIYVPDTNICTHRVLRHGDCKAAFSKADMIIEGRYTTPSSQHCCMEPQCCTARIESDGAVTIFDSTQSVYRIRKALSRVLGKRERDIHIIVPYLGGGFGEKNSVNLELIAIGLAMHTHGRPVKVAMNRSEEFTAGGSKHAAVVYIRSAVKRDGTILAREVRAYYDTGAYAHTGPTVAGQSGLTAAGPYRIDNVDLDIFAVYTNKIPAGSFRGYGTSQLCWAYEQHTCDIAQRLGMDAMELRRRTLLGNGDENMCGEIMRENALRTCLEKAAKRIGDLDSVETVAPNILRARGIACAWKLTGAPSVHLATLRMEQDGSAIVCNSTSEMGQGCMPLWQAIVCEELALKPEDVKVKLPDSEVTPYTEGTTSSRAGALDGYAVCDAARKVREQLFALASPVLGASAEYLELADKSVRVKRSGKQISYEALMAKCGIGHVGGLLAQGECRTDSVIRVNPENGQSPYPTSLWLQVAQAVEIELNTVTGEIQVKKCVSAHDIGKVLSLTNCEQQVQGGVLMGIGCALYEELITDGKGRVRNASFLDYKMPTVRQAPKIECIFVEDEPSACGVYGAKGLGEGANIAIPAAVANAVFRATGIQFNDLPITAERMFWALKKQRKLS